MQTVRRLYLYLMSGVTLGVLAVGLQFVLVVLLDAMGVGRGSLSPFDPNANRQQLSLAAALIGVGLPVWAIHWWVVERGLRPGAMQVEQERGSTVRALYLTLTLGVLLAIGAGAGSELLRGLFQQLLGASPDFGRPDFAGSLATIVVTVLAWGYHVAIRRRDMGVGPLAGAAAWLPRVYLYGAALGGLFAALAGIESLLTYIGRAVLPTSSTVNEPGFDGFFAAGALAAILVGGAVWLGHWWYATRLVGNADWRGESERPARLRIAYFVSVILVATFSVIRLSAAALTALLGPVLGATSDFGAEQAGRDLARTAGVALVSALPWAITWWFHRRAMSREAAASADASRISAVVRLDRHANAVVGLAFGAVGMGWLLGLLVDLLLGGDRTSSGLWRSELSTFLPIAVIGSGVWLWWWWRIRARHANDMAGEAASTVRRSYLLIVLAASVIASLASMALILYRLFGTLLGANLGGNTASDLSTPIGAVVIAGAIGFYHGQALRRDAAMQRTEAVPERSQTEASPTERRLVLVGPADGELGAAVDALRGALPPGYRLDDA